MTGVRSTTLLDGDESREAGENDNGRDEPGRDRFAEDQK